MAICEMVFCRTDLKLPLKVVSGPNKGKYLNTDDSAFDFGFAKEFKTIKVSKINLGAKAPSGGKYRKKWWAAKKIKLSATTSCDEPAFLKQCA